MAREYDIVVFGASGFTGAQVVRYLRTLNLDLNIALSGRNRDKVQEVNTKFGSEYPIEVADVKDAASMASVCGKTRLLLNCVGPYRFFGEAVVKACVEAGTHYLDISGEPEFIERIEFLYNDKAKQKGCTVVSACGFDSIPADMGTVYAVSQFPAGGQPSFIESFLSIKGDQGVAAHYTTYECAVHGFGSAAELKSLRRKQPKVNIPKQSRMPPKATLPTWDERVQAYKLPFPGSDASIVRRSQKQLVAEGSDKLAIQYNAFFTISSGLWTSVFTLFGGVFSAMASFSLGRSVLLKYPELFSWGIFSHQGPSEEQLKATTFEMDFFTSGFSNASNAGAQKATDTQIHTRVSGPEPGYVATPICLVQCALTVLEDDVPPGVTTTATAFRNSKLIERLSAHGLKFETLTA